MEIQTKKDRIYYLTMCLTNCEDGLEINGKGEGSLIAVKAEINGSPNMATVQTMLEQMVNELNKKYYNKQ